MSTLKNKTSSKSPNIVTKKPFSMVVISDCHAGHVVGLTPPEWQGRYVDEDVAKHNKFIKVQKAMWDFFSDEIINLKKDKPIDLLVSNGDIIDGTGWRSGGCELITTDRLKQVAIAKNIVDFVGAKDNCIIGGTPYHVGAEEEFEAVLAEQLKCKYENHAFIEINKQVFDIKHHIGSSSIPQGRHSAISKEGLWSKLWQAADLIPSNVQYLIRSHVHYFSLISDSQITCLTTPALQGFGSRYGSKLCSGIPTIGFISFDIYPNGQISMQKHFANMEHQKAKSIIFNT